MRKRRNKKSAVKQAERRQGAKADPRYKDTVFRMLFRDKKRLLGLYNAIGGRNYEDPEKLDIVTLESAVYMGVKNDLAFIVDMKLYLFEHQSTVNKNMPLRFLQYVSAEYEKLIVSEDLHKRMLVKVPSPHFVVFYNGTEKYAERQELRLSAAYEVKEEEPELELRVQVLNINEGFNEGLKEACLTLREYMQYVDKVRAYKKNMPLDRAVDRAVNECIAQGILRDFLLQNKAEVKRMSIFEYNEENVRRVLREEAYEDGMEEGDLKRLVSLVCKKMKMNQSLEKIAEDLIEEIPVIEPLYRAAKKFAPEYDPESVFEEIVREKDFGETEN